MTAVRNHLAALSVLALTLAVSWATPGPAIAMAEQRDAHTRGPAAGDGWNGPILTRAWLVRGAIRVTAVAECADVEGGSSLVTITVSQVGPGGRLITGSEEAGADCYPRSLGGHDGKVTIAVRPDGAGAFQPGSAMAVRDDQEGIRLGDDFGYFDAEVRWAKLDVLRPGGRPAPSTPAPGSLDRAGTDPQPTGPSVSIEGVAATRVSRGAGVVVRMHGVCTQGTDFGFAEKVSVTVSQRRLGSPPIVAGTKASTAFDSLACDAPDPGWIDVPVIPDGVPFLTGPVIVTATYTASFGAAPTTFEVSDSARVRRFLN